MAEAVRPVGGRPIIVFADQRPPMTPAAQKLLDGYEHRVLSNEAGKAELDAAVADATVLVTGLRPIGADVIALAPHLKGIVASGAGYDHIDVAAASGRNIVVTCTPGANAVAVAELTIGLMLDLARRITFNANAVNNGEWTSDDLRWRSQGRELAGSTLGIIGFGRVGKEIAARAAALGMRVLPYTRNPSPDRARAAGVTFLPLDEVVSGADFLVAACAVTKETRHLVNRDLIGRMKRSAYFLNVARGAVVDQDALLEALSSKRIAGAAVDVLDREPPGERHPFFGVQNLLVTSHLGGRTDEAHVRLTMMVAEESLSILRAELPRNSVNGASISWDGAR